MSATKSKISFCHYCGERIFGPVLSVDGNPCCLSCFDKAKAESDKNAEKIKDLTSYVRSLFSADHCSQSTMSAIKKAMGEGRKPLGIKATLQYYYIVKGNPRGKMEDIWWIVRDYYDEAKSYAIEQEKQRKRIAAMGKDPVVVYEINAPEPNAPRFNYKMEDL